MVAKHDGGHEETDEPDSVVSAHADPVGDGAVLALLLGQLLLDPEGLVGRLRGGTARTGTNAARQSVRSRTSA